MTILDSGLLIWLTYTLGICDTL